MRGDIIRRNFLPEFTPMAAFHPEQLPDAGPLIQ